MAINLLSNSLFTAKSLGLTDDVKVIARSAVAPANRLTALINSGISAAPNKVTTRATTSSSDTTDGPDILVTARERPADNRLRLSALSGQEDKIYGGKDRFGNILAPLYTTGGMMFPFTPTIQVSGETSWTSHDLTHTNFDTLSYQRTASATIGITGKFTVQNQREGEYALAVIHFLRVVGKMYYGDQDSAQFDAKNRTTTNSLAGLPPPVMRLRGYGTYMFNDIKCVLKNYSYSFEDNMDLVTINSPTGGDVMLPPVFSINLTLGLQQSPAKVRTDFKLNDFRTGDLMRTQKGWF